MVLLAEFATWLLSQTHTFFCLSQMLNFTEHLILSLHVCDSNAPVGSAAGVVLAGLDVVLGAACGSFGPPIATHTVPSNPK